MDDITSPPAKPGEPAQPAAPAPEDQAASQPQASEAPAPETARAAEPAGDEPKEPAATNPEQKPEKVESAAPAASDATKKRSSMPLVVSMVVIAVLALGVVAYFAFLKENTNKTVDTNATDSTSQATTEPETPDDVSGAIDESLSDIDETEDYDSNGLSDTSLNL